MFYDLVQVFPQTKSAMFKKKFIPRVSKPPVRAFSGLVLNSLTVSHLARARSSSNFANSRLSWMVTRSFQMSRAAKPRNKMAPATDRSNTKISGPLGQSGLKKRSDKAMSKVPMKIKTGVRGKSDFLRWFPPCFEDESSGYHSFSDLKE